MNTKMPYLIALCFEARTKAHIAHLQTRSYAAHKALNEYYDGIVDIADSLAEAFQGREGIL
jgi:DNA-binding ferritin-like protein